VLDLNDLSRVTVKIHKPSPHSTAVIFFSECDLYMYALTFTCLQRAQVIPRKY
jgi:hypothetical protein